MSVVAADVLDPDQMTEDVVTDLAIDLLDVMNIDTEGHQIVATNVGMTEEMTMVVEETVDLAAATEAVMIAMAEGKTESNAVVALSRTVSVMNQKKDQVPHTEAEKTEIQVINSAKNKQPLSPNDCLA